MKALPCRNKPSLVNVLAQLNACVVINRERQVSIYRLLIGGLEVRVKLRRKRERRISSVRSFVNERVIGQPDFDSRIIVFRRVSSSAVESIFYVPCDSEREVRIESRSERVEAGILNA